jgi:hypothetical protein
MCAMLFDSSKKLDKPLQCPDCDIDMFFLGSRPTRRVFASTILVRVFFLCPNCQRLSHRLVAMPQGSYHPQSGFDFEAPPEHEQNTTGVLGTPHW